MPHQAAWLNEHKTTLVVATAETPSPGPTELLVKVQAIAFNPVEAKMQRLDLPMSPKQPTILGLSFAGTIEAVGAGVKDFRQGDRIVTQRPGKSINDPRFGAFQQYALASSNSTSRLLPETTFEAAAATIANLNTAVAALSIFQGLDRPDLTAVAPSNDEKILIYGGSSSSGGLAVQYARAAGYTVVTTSSPKNHEYVASLNPTVIIDHTQTSETVVSEIAFNGPYIAILDCIGTSTVDKIFDDYLTSIGGGQYRTLASFAPAPKGVERKFESFGWVLEAPANEEVRGWFYNDFLPNSLASGIIKPTPQEWVRGGLKEAQKALDLLFEGKVSAKKLVMNPWEE